MRVSGKWEQMGDIGRHTHRALERAGVLRALWESSRCGESLGVMEAVVAHFPTT